MIDPKLTYNEFIQNIIDTRGKWNIPEGEYYEAHHIVPKCLGGEPKSYHHGRKTKHENIIWLYPHEHYRAHELLALENPDNFSILSAWNRMVCNKQGEYVSEDGYTFLRTEFSKKNSEFHKGRHLSEEAKKKVSEFNKGKVFSPETRKKLSDAWKHRGPMSQEQRDYLSKIKKGKPNSTSRPILCIETRTIYPMIILASRDLNIHSSNIASQLTGRRKSAKGYHFKYIDIYEEI